MKLFAALVLLLIAAVDAQRRVQGPAAQSTVAMTVALKAGDKAYDFSGQGKCTHAPIASIYGLRAERWTAERSGEGPSATVAVWRPASGSDLVSVSFALGEARYAMSTIKVGSNGRTEGSGTIAFARDGAGGTFTINGIAGNGTKISGSVKCAAFTPAVAEGGD
jgi:hypothetical protein